MFIVTDHTVFVQLFSLLFGLVMKDNSNYVLYTISGFKNRIPHASPINYRPSIFKCFILNPIHFQQLFSNESNK